MKQGLYRIRLLTSLGEDIAMAVLSDGRILGGDARFTYVGEYTNSGDTFSADMLIRQHADTPGMATALGLLPITLRLRGTVTGDLIDATGAAQEYPDRECQAELEWLEA